MKEGLNLEGSWEIETQSYDNDQSITKDPIQEIKK